MGKRLDCLERLITEVLDTEAPHRVKDGSTVLKTRGLSANLPAKWLAPGPSPHAPRMQAGRLLLPRKGKMGNWRKK